MPRFFVLIILSIFYSCKPHQQSTETKEAALFHPFGLDSLNKIEDKYVEEKYQGDTISSKELSLNAFLPEDSLTQKIIIDKYGVPDSIHVGIDEINGNEPFYQFCYQGIYSNN